MLAWVAAVDPPPPPPPLPYVQNSQTKDSQIKHNRKNRQHCTNRSGGIRSADNKRSSKTKNVLFIERASVIGLHVQLHLAQSQAFALWTIYVLLFADIFLFWEPENFSTDVECMGFPIYTHILLQGFIVEVR